jgi:hypothetical protein
MWIQIQLTLLNSEDYNSDWRRDEEAAWVGLKQDLERSHDQVAETLPWMQALLHSLRTENLSNDRNSDRLLPQPSLRRDDVSIYLTHPTLQFSLTMYGFQVSRQGSLLPSGISPEYPRASSAAAHMLI